MSLAFSLWVMSADTIDLPPDTLGYIIVNDWKPEIASYSHL